MQSMRSDVWRVCPEQFLVPDLLLCATLDKWPAYTSVRVVQHVSCISRKYLTSGCAGEAKDVYGQNIHPTMRAQS